MKRMGKLGKQFLSIAAGTILMLEVLCFGSVYGESSGAEWLAVLSLKIT